jgi:transposase
VNKSSKPMSKIKSLGSSKHETSTATPGKRGRQCAGTIGLDVGDRLSHVCVLGDDGEVLFEGKVRTTPEAMRQYFADVRRSRIALESGTHSAWLNQLLRSLDHEVIVADARELRKIHQSDRKNDRADAQILARMARFDPQLLAPITHRSAQMQTDITVIRARDCLVGARTKCVNAVRGFVKSTGARLPQCSTRTFSHRALDQLGEELRPVLLPLINTIEALSEQIHQYDREIEDLTKRYPETTLLRQVRGVGALTATAFLLTLSDPSRFRHSRDVGAYLGLVPRQDDSGNRVSQLSITKAGNRLLRRLLVGSAQYILGPFGTDCELRRYGERMMERGGKNAKKRAVVAVARKLAVLLHRLWITGEVYRPLREPATANQPNLDRKVA